MPRRRGCLRKLMIYALCFGVLAILVCRLVLSNATFGSDFPTLTPKTATVDRRTIEWAEAGNVEAEVTLVFLHGSPGILQMFGDLMEDEEMAAKFHMLSIARPGFGETTPTEGSPSLDVHARAAFDAVEASGANGKVLLAGHSYGGPVALYTALNYPEKISGAALIAASVAPELEFTRPLNALLRVPPLSFALPGQWGASNREIYGLRPELEAMEDALPNLKLPISMIHGTEDKLVPIGNVDYVSERVPTELLAVRKIEGGDHFIPWTHVAEVKAELIRLAESIAE